MQLFDISVPHSEIILPLLAIVAGLVILLNIKTGTLIVVAILLIVLLIALAAVFFMLR